jgi:hypothetical protein
VIPADVWQLAQQLFREGCYNQAAALVRIHWERSVPSTYDDAFDLMVNALDCLQITIGANMLPAVAALASVMEALGKAGPAIDA